MNAYELAEAEALQQQLKIGITKVPPGYKDWSYQQVLDFKACIQRCKHIANKTRLTSLQEVKSAHGALSAFWGGR